MDFLSRLLALLSGVALLLALAGIYSVMAFTVSRRTREIGIRIALGAEPRDVVRAVFGRALRQVGAGILAGGLLVGALSGAVVSLSTFDLLLIAVYMAVMLGVCLLACVSPIRRAFAVEPTEALRADG